MQRKGLTIINAVALLLYSPLSVAQKETIYWHTFHRPPSSIKTGDMVGKSFLDRVTYQLIKAMPNYSHFEPMSSPKRTESAMRDGKKVCHPVYLKNKERSKFAYFSKPSVVAPSIRLVGLSVPDGLETEKVRLEELDKDSTFVFHRGRAHNETIDGFIKNLPDERKMVLSTNKTKELFKLVALGKIDYTFSYPIEVNYFNQQHSAQNLTSWQVKDVQQYVVGYVACSKSPWGKDVIEQVNLALAKLAGSKSYWHAMTSWWPEEVERQEFIDFHRTHFLNEYQK